MKKPVIFDGRNIYDPAADSRARLHVLLDRPSMSTVVVTGGAGYVGSHAVKALAAAGYDVVVFDDLSAGHAEAVDRIARAFPDRTITLVAATSSTARRSRATLESAGATAVMHFAARLLVGESVREPIGYYRANVTGTMTVLDAMAEAGVGRFVFSSTAATFGEPKETPIDETHPQQPINAYGETKLAIERALPHVERATGIRWAVLRYFNAAGADPDGLLGEDHDPEEHLIPLRWRPWPAAAADRLRRRLSDAGRHLHPRLRARQRPRGCARRGAAGARTRTRPRPPTISATARACRCGRSSTRSSRVTGRPVPHHDRRAAPRRSGAARRLE